MKGQHFSSWSAIGAAFKKRREQTLSSSLKLSDFSFPPPPPSPPSSAIATSPLASAAAISVTAVGIAASSTPGFNKSFDDFFVPLSQRERKHQTLIEQLLALVSPVGGRRPAHVTLALDAPQSTQTSSAAFDSASVSAETRALSRRAGKAAQFFDKVLKAINHHIQERRSGAAGALTIDIEAVLQHSPWKQILARAEEVKISQQLAANAIELKNMAGRALTETIVGVLGFKPVYGEVSTGLVAWSRRKAIHKRSKHRIKIQSLEKDVLASHIISLDICMQPSGESEGSSLQIASTDQEHIKKDLRLYNCT
eukprot:g1006.t1